MKKKSNKLLLLVVSQIIFLILLIGIFEVLVRADILNSLYFPAPSNIVIDIFRLFTDESIWVHVYTTLIEFIAGYALAVLLGISFGMFLVLVPWAEEFFQPFISALMAIPKVTIVPLLALWLGIGLEHKVTIVFLFCFFTILVNTITGIKQTEEKHLKVARVYRATVWQTIWKVTLPSAAPTIFAGLKVSAATGLVGALFAEMLASKEGLGNLLVKATNLFNTSQAFAIVVIVTVIAVLIIAVINLIERKIFLKWKEKMKFGG
jgi:NitT/TauT family transport system permease protein